MRRPICAVASLAALLTLSASPALALAIAVFYAVCYVFLRHLEKHRLFLRL